MNMNKLYIILILATSFFLTSCFEDETSFATRPLSEITIEEGTVCEVYNIGKDEVLRITPGIIQSNKQKALTYTWEIDLETYSHDKEFVYVGDKLGSFLMGMSEDLMTIPRLSEVLIRISIGDFS